MRFYTIIVFAVALASGACAHQAVRPVQTGPISINDATFTSEVSGYDGFALVIFYNSDYWQSREMEERFDFFARKYGGAAKFCSFYWKIGADDRPYGLEMLPTVVLYKGSVEIDRIRGIPPDEKSLMKFNDDIDLWMKKNVLGLEGDRFLGKFRYLFDNGYTLKPRN